MPTINYNAALPAFSSISGRSSIDINKWVSELKFNISSLIKSLFANNEQGFAYDPNDLTTMFQDAAGTVPVTAAGQPVGLMLDKSKGLVLGTEAIIGGNFESGLVGAITNGNGSVSEWKLNTVNPISGTQDGKLTVSTPASFRPVLLFNGEAKTIGAVYELSFDYKVVAGNPVIGLIFNGSSTHSVNRELTGTGRFTARYVAVGSGISEGVYFSASSPFSLQIDNLSSKQVLGDHAYQSVSASRPILQQTPILGSELLANGGFSNGLTGWTATGTPTFTASGGRAYYNGAGGSGSGNLASSDVLAVGKKYIVSYDYEVVQGSFNCGGTHQTVLGGRSITGKGRRQFEITVSDSRDKGVRFGPENSQSICEVYLDNISVKEITGYHTDQNYLKFDGVDDRITTTLPAQLTDCTVIRSVPNVGTHILTNQTIPTPYNDNINNCGLIVINRALTPSETSAITAEFNKRAGV